MSTIEIPDGMIEPSSHFGKLLGFTSDLFDGWLWRKGDVLMVSFIESKESGKGNFRALMDRFAGRRNRRRHGTSGSMEQEAMSTIDEIQSWLERCGKGLRYLMACGKERDDFWAELSTARERIKELESAGLEILTHKGWPSETSEMREKWENLFCAPPKEGET